jgi:hypothetical protein
MANLSFIRKFKANFIRFGLHRLIPFKHGMLNIIYLAKISEWHRKQPKIKFNDFYSSGWDYNKRYKLYEYLCADHQTTEKINYLEFGVAAGKSFKWWVEHNQHTESEFHGFDTFTGLPEDWGPFKAGAMSNGNKPPEVNDNRVTFYTGLFQQTLPGYIEQLKKDNSKRKIIHLDADLYSATLYVLSMLAPYLNKGDIILFDEFAVPQSEFLAYSDFIRSFYIELELIAAANNYFFVAFKVK